jgi:hypothetical protein
LRDEYPGAHPFPVELIHEHLSKRVLPTPWEPRMSPLFRLPISLATDVFASPRLIAAGASKNNVLVHFQPIGWERRTRYLAPAN